MNRLDKNRRTQVVRCHVEGNPTRATVQLTWVSKDAIQRLLAALAPACAQFQHRAMRNLPCKPCPSDLAGNSGNGSRDSRSCLEYRGNRGLVGLESCDK